MLYFWFAVSVIHYHGSSFCFRSSNRDPGARAADSLSPKDHGGGFCSVSLCNLFSDSNGQALFMSQEFSFSLKLMIVRFMSRCILL